MNERPPEVKHGELLGAWARARREAQGLDQGDVAERMASILGADVEPNWVTQLETGRKVRLVPQPHFGALVRALGAAEVEALRAVGLLPDPPKALREAGPPYDGPYRDLVELVPTLSEESARSVLSFGKYLRSQDTGSPDGAQKRRARTSA